MRPFVVSKGDDGYMQQSTGIQTDKSRSFSSQFQSVDVIDVIAGIAGATEALRNDAADCAIRSVTYTRSRAKLEVLAINVQSDSERNMI